MKIRLECALLFALVFPVATATVIQAQQVSTQPGSSPQRPQGPCDIYAAANTPCVAAHSTTRALYAAYNGPLYQIKRASNGATTNIGTLAAGGYANAAAQDSF